MKSAGSRAFSTRAEKQVDGSLRISGVPQFSKRTLAWSVVMSFFFRNAVFGSSRRS